MKIKERYEKYQIMPTLAEHMLRVGAVAKILTSQIKESGFPSKEIISACLLHDMGNIVKFDLDNVPAGLDIPNIEHWKEVQKKVIDQYGLDEHDATYQMAKDMGVSKVTLDAISNCGTAKAKKVLEEKSIPAMFVTYSDYHVAPTEIVTPEDRLNNILIRYKNTPKYEGYVRDGNNVLEIAHYLEKQYSLDKQQVNEISVKTVVSELLEWELV
ncbi:MAG: hypothetical protein KBC12_02200 [Candidatus Pacebacteria bacterium]|nr:hypothetical protein [Candidatus Paceibacterota bacterium]MBP9851233.1 hypothetical protein [Candidatus Paceibacterota bacterium]